MRIPEASPLMLNIDQCRAYDSYASTSVQLREFVDTYRELIKVEYGTVIDLGCGPCNFVIALAKEFSNLKFVCYEGSKAMIDIAKENIVNAGLSSRIDLIHDDIYNAVGTYDVVIANRLLHHINDTDSFWELIHRLSRNVLVVDINRPPARVIEHIQEFDQYAESIYKRDLISSMQASYSLDEVSKQIEQYGYKIFSDRCYKLFVYQTR
jgi:SAM-dependent methyltransferase